VHLFPRRDRSHPQQRTPLCNPQVLFPYLRRLLMTSSFSRLPPPTHPPTPFSLMFTVAPNLLHVRVLLSHQQLTFLSTVETLRREIATHHSFPANQPQRVTRYRNIFFRHEEPQLIFLFAYLLIIIARTKRSVVISIYALHTGVLFIYRVFFFCRCCCCFSPTLLPFRDTSGAYATPTVFDS
jgi:hypothetical protein